MTLRARLALRYSILIGICLLLLAGLAYHEFVTEPWQREVYGIPETPGNWFSEYVEVFIYAAIPIVLVAGWWSMRSTVAPINELATRVDQIRLENLRTPLVRSGTGDEVDRLTEAFNALTARLDRSFRQLSQFTLHASHELKTPLTVMQMQLETILKDPGARPAESREWLENQLVEIQRIAKVVDALLLLTRADSGMVNLERKPVRLEEIVRESFADAQVLAEPRDITVKLLECADVTVSGDRGRLRQVLLNLIDNAVKYNRPEGTVTLAVRAGGGMGEIELTNTGDPIPPDLLPAVFDRFVRGEGARRKSADGCGLGLAICKWIIEEHGGTIGITSGPDWTTVLVRLPKG